jgi:hypothetical protein
MFARAGWMVILVAAGAAMFGAAAMSQGARDLALRKYFEDDDRYPFIDQNAEPRGRLRHHASGVGQVWSGKSGWRTRHGNAVVVWSRGRPIRVWNALLADGTEVDASPTGISASSWRYRLPGKPRRWQHGTAEIRSDGVSFTPGEPPPYVPPVAIDGPNLEADLAHDDALRRRLADEAFADVLFAYLRNGEFWKEGGERIWSIGHSSAGALVANLRGHGDIYTDYYPFGGAEKAAVQEKMATWSAEITSMLQVLGWRRATVEDKTVAATYTRRDLASWEERPAGETPAWATKLRPPSAQRGRVILRAQSGQMTDQQRERHEEIVSQSLQKRLYALAISGRITEAEYRSMARRIHQIP